MLRKLLTILILSLLANFSSAQKLVKAKRSYVQSYPEERTYIGDQKEFLDTITGTKVTRTLIVTERRYKEFALLDTLMTYEAPIMDYRKNYETIFDFEADSLLIFFNYELYDDYDLQNGATTQMYEDMLHFGEKRGYRSMQFDLFATKNKKEIQEIATFSHNNMSIEDIHKLPLRPFIKQEIDTLGQDSIEFKTEIARPMTYEEIYDTIAQYKSFGIDSLKSKGIDPFQYLAEIVRINFMIPYYYQNITKPYVREEVTRQLKRLYNERVAEFNEKTGYDFRKARSLQNVIQKKKVISHNPRYINKDTYIIYINVNDSIKPKEVMYNENGTVSVNFSQINTESLKVVAQNLAYEMDKWVKKNWDDKYGKKPEYNEDGFEPDD